MNAPEIRGWSNNEIQKKLEDAHHELFNLRFQVAVGQLKQFGQFKQLKKDIARMNTILNERRLASLL